MKQRQSAWLGVWSVLVLVCAGIDISYMAGCAGNNPVAAATDTPQRAYALYGTFVIVEEQAAKVVQDPSTNASLKRAIQVADAKAKPSADALAVALQQYESASAAMKAGSTTADKLSIATNNVSTWLHQAQGDINALLAAVHAVPGH